MLLNVSIDPGPMLPCRGNLLLALQRAAGDAALDRTPLSFLLIQVDRVPANHARLIQVEQLATVAKVLRLACGRAGVLGHMNDRLFGLMRRNTTADSARAVAEHCRLAVELHYTGRLHPMTLSIGTATTTDESEWTGEQLVRLAAWRCDQAQVAGGNQVRSTGFALRDRLSNR